MSKETQQVMSPNDQGLNFEDLIEETPARIKKEPKVVESQEEMTTVPTRVLEKLAERLELLEGRERSRRETEEAKKNASRIFKQWDVDIGQGLNLNDLEGSYGKPEFEDMNKNQSKNCVLEFHVQRKRSSLSRSLPGRSSTKDWERVSKNGEIAFCVPSTWPNMRANVCGLKM